VTKSLKRLVKGAVTVLLVLCVFSGKAVAEIKLGILPRLGAVELFTMFNPLAEYLTKATGQKVSILIPRDFAAFKTAVRSGNIDIGFANPLIYVQLRKEMALEPLAVSSERKCGTRFRGIIIARKDSGIETILDLRGKRLIFVDHDSTGGYLLQVLVFKRSGLDIRNDITLLPFAKKHDHVVMAVFNRAADAGGMREDDLEKMKNKIDLSQIKIISYTDFSLNWPIFATSTLAEATVLKIKAALIKLKPNDPVLGKILASAKLAGFAPVADKDYEQLRRAVEVVGEL
jgi:phosphonate transport system substrate-binding protein